MQDQNSDLVEGTAEADATPTPPDAHDPDPLASIAAVEAELAKSEPDTTALDTIFAASIVGTSEAAGSAVLDQHADSGYRPVGGAEIARYLNAKSMGLTGRPSKADVDAFLASKGL